MIPTDYDALVDGIREAGDIHTYLKMVGLVALIESGLSQSTIRHAASDALEHHDRTGRRHAEHFEILLSLAFAVSGRTPPGPPSD